MMATVRCPCPYDSTVLLCAQINLNIELIFSEFVEGLVRTADLIHREKVSDVAERIERLLQHLEKQANA
jgi:signal transduction protein with GAF and PtsI domain